MMMKKIAPIIFLVCSAVLQVQAVVVTLDVFANEHGAVVINLGDVHQHFPVTLFEEFEVIAHTLLKTEHDIELILERQDLSDNANYQDYLLFHAMEGPFKFMSMPVNLDNTSSLLLMNTSKFWLDLYNEKFAFELVEDAWLSISKKCVDVRSWMVGLNDFLTLLKCCINQESVRDISRHAVNTLLNKSYDAPLDLNDGIIALYQKILEKLDLNYLNQITVEMKSSVNEGSNISQEARFALLRSIEVSEILAEKIAPLARQYFSLLLEESARNIQDFYVLSESAGAIFLELFDNLVEVNAFLQIAKKQTTVTRSIVFLGAAHMREDYDFLCDLPEATLLGINRSVKSIQQLALECRNFHKPGLNDLLFFNGYTKLASYNLLASAFDDQTKEFTLEGCRKVIAQLKEKLSYWVNLPTEEIIQLVKADQEKEMLARARAHEQRRIYKKYREQRYKSPEFMKKKRLDDLQKDNQRSI